MEQRNKASKIALELEREKNRAEEQKAELVLKSQKQKFLAQKEERERDYQIRMFEVLRKQ